MKNLFLFFLLLFTLTKTYAQLPPWNTKFIVYHPDGFTDTLWIGCDENATDGNDEGLDMIDTSFHYPLAIRGYSQEIENDSAFGSCVNLRKDVRGFGYPAVFTFYVLHDELSGSLDNALLIWDSTDYLYSSGLYKISDASILSYYGYIGGIDGTNIPLFGRSEIDTNDISFYFDDSIALIPESSVSECYPSEYIVKIELYIWFKDFTIDINENAPSNIFKIYPSVTNDFVNIDSPPANYHLEVYDSTGKRITNEIINKIHTTIDLNGKPVGEYYFLIKDQLNKIIYSQIILKQ